MKSLILTDIQNDFLPGGELPVPEGNEILPIVKKLLSLPFDLVLATLDWHPIDHVSFAANHQKIPGEKIIVGNIEQVLWPTHCTQGSKGAELANEIDSHKISKKFFKGINPSIDSYSAFFDVQGHSSTGLFDYLHSQKVTDTYFAGLATDYCIKYSALDALLLGFKVFVVTDACRGVNVQPNDSILAFKEMERAGINLITFKEVENSFLAT